jgi:energy-coupling factor transport system permease protein
MTNLFNYIDRPSPIHQLTGASKLVFLVLWSAASMTTFYTPLLLAMTIAALALFKVSNVRFRDVSFLLGFTVVFLVMNNLLIFLFSPLHGVSIYGTRHDLLPIYGDYVITAEQLLYHLNVVLKYTCSIPVILLFVCTTNPSEFAASLNRIGVSYRIAYSIALALRYIPDIQREFRDISLAQQARGLEMSKKANPIYRLQSACSILVPLVLSSMDRIETISNAMELRGFGKNKKRTWYMSRRFSRGDIATIVLSIAVMVVSVLITILNGSRYFNPFI